MAEIKIDTSFTNNMVLILDCLPTGEMQTAVHLFEALRDLQDIKITGHCRYLRVSNRQEFCVALEKVRKLCQRNWPILHIEAHGDESHGLRIGDAEDQYGWDELADEMRLCNAACGHNFGVILAACHGSYLKRRVSAVKGAPFHFLISCNGEISALEVERQMVRFHSTFFRTASFDEACSTLSSDMSVFRSHVYFLQEYGRHYKKRLIGKGRRQEIEKLVTTNLSKYSIVKEHLGVKKVREIAEKVTTPLEGRYVEQSQQFFHGQVPISYSDFIAYLRSLPEAPDGFYDGG